MLLSKKKYLAATATTIGAIALLISPASQANWWYRHHYHRAGKRVHYRGCRKIVVRRYCRINDYGDRICKRVRRVHWIC